MALSWMSRLLKKKTRLVSRPSRRWPNQGRFLPALEPLSERVLPAVTASFSPSSQLLSILGDAASNNIVVSRDAAGKILVNGGAVSVKGGTPTVANTALIQVFGQGGDDQITLSEVNGALPAAQLFGGAGNDTLTGGSGGDLLFGQGGNDTLLGKGGFDQLFGGADNDTLTGGDADDQVFGQAGNDRMIWNPGDDTDLNEGGDGIDTVEVNGGNGAEIFTVTPNGTRVRFDRTTSAPFSIDIGTSENLVLNANGGDDTFTGSNGLANLIQITADGGAGNDTLTGGDGNDQLLGGDGNDVVNGGRGNDTAVLGAGDDTFVWNPGDGNDAVEGQDGVDTLQFNGANINEKIDLSANGPRLRLTRDIANVTMDTDGVEVVNIVTLAGADNITVNDLTGTSVTQVNLDLAGTPGSGTGDNLADNVIVNGTNASDTILVAGSASGVTVSGLKSTITIKGSDAALDQLTVNAQGGDDVVNASGLEAGVIGLTINGGLGADKIVGSQGNDLVNGGDGDDVGLMGAGDDTFVWNPGDDNDSVEGQDGVDTLQFNGANIAEKIDLSANGPRLRLTRDIATVVMDADGVEVVNIAALGGADTITLNDLSGTSVSEVNLNLALANGSGDASADTVVVQGTNGDDIIVVVGGPGGISVVGLPATLNIVGSEPANDQLTVRTQAGDDVVEASGLTAGGIRLTEDGGDGDDILIGSEGDDNLIGGAGDDVLIGGLGLDVLNGAPGADVVIQ
jgi:Ca2+-binding RTX toxin-like protein